jgi:two-component system invasion response regulator UvrY
LPGDPLRNVPRVVLVDDDNQLRARIRELLEDDGSRVIGEAPCGTAALELVPAAAAHLPAVVVMDVRMPGGLNGIDATRLLVELMGARVRVVLFTGFPDPGIEQAAREAGAVAVLLKGVGALEIITTIRHAWADVLVGR